MNDYYKVDFHLSPFSEDASDLLASDLAEIGFESFEQNDKTLVAYIKSELYDKEALRQTIDNFIIPDIAITFQESFIEGKDWNEEWEKNYFKPIVIEGKCVVHATFHHDYPACQYEIIIDPKMAFGTGHHATTTMMIKHILGLDIDGKRVIDMGSGTGILSILCKKKGAKEVAGIEIDPAAWENSINNANLNREEIKLIRGDASSLEDLDSADLFLANINRNIILADLSNYVDKIKDNGILLLSGFYKSDVAILESALNRNGMKIADTMTEDEWCSIKAVKIAGN